MIDVADAAVLDALCPMHLLLDARGVIVGAGPTIAKVYGGPDLIGQSFLSVFELRRPRTVISIKDITGQGPQKLQLKLQSPPYTALRGIILPLNAKGAKMIVNLSFGISIIDAVRDFALTNADFATTDLAIEMLFLVEAKTAAMEASYRLNMRLQGAKIAAEQQAFTDMLTGLKNRRAIDQTLSHMLAKKKPFAVMHIDLDYFKEINDTLGHAAGDYVLQAVARNMVMETRQEDVVARVGGDEFTILLPSVAAESILRNIGRRIIRNLEEPINFHGHECRISASIGTVWVKPEEQPSMEEVMSNADVALYASKTAGRARQTLYRPELRLADDAVGANTDWERREIPRN